MGGNGSSRLDFEPDHATVVKGIRLTDRVIDRMKESPRVVHQHPNSKGQAHPPAGQPAAPLKQPWSPGEGLVPILPHSPTYASSLVPPPLQQPVVNLTSQSVPLASVTPETPLPGDSSTPSVETVPPPTPVEPSAQEHVAILLPTEPISVTPTSSTESSTVTAGLVEPPTTPAEPSEPVVTTVEAVIPTPTTEPITLTVEPTLSLSATEPSNAPTELAPELVAASEAPPSPDAPLTMPASPLEEPLPSSPPVTIEPSKIPSDTVARHDEPTDMPGSQLGETVAASSPLSIPSAMPEDLVTPQSSSALAIPSELPSVGQIGPSLTEETPAPPSSAYSTEPAVAQVLPPLTEAMIPLSCPSKPQAVVTEDELKQQIKDELQKQLREEMKMAELKIQQQLEEEKATAKAEAEAKARLQIQAEVQKALEAEQITLQQSLKDAVMKERMNTEDERLVAQYYWMERKIQKLEEKERDLAKQDSLYREQITKLEEKTAQFTQVTAESFRKGLEDTRKRFKKYQIRPVCSELQSEILKCYRENAGQTLTCSNIASLYMQCVDNAKQNKKVSTGG